MTKSQAVLLAEVSGGHMVVYHRQGCYHTIHKALLSHLPSDAVVEYQTGKASNYREKPRETNKTFKYVEGERRGEIYGRTETVDPDGRVISRSNYVEPKVQDLPRTTRNRQATGS